MLAFERVNNLKDLYNPDENGSHMFPNQAEYVIWFQVELFMTCYALLSWIVNNSGWVLCCTFFFYRVKHRWKDICSFQVFPAKCQTSLQLYELVDDYIQEEIRKPPKKTKCSVCSIDIVTLTYFV